ncbi:MAG: type II toxin-antitoxin system RelE/ParE family toxin [Bacteroidota bacterium]
MSYSVIATPLFKREFKRLIKKHHSLAREFDLLINSLEDDPQQGTSIGQHCFKIRLAIASKGKGKSGGARLITCVRVVETTVYLLTIFDKSEKENIPDKELKQLIRLLP